MTQSSQAKAATKKHVIVFLAANPRDTGRLELDREARSIHLELKRSGYRDRFDFVTRWAAEPLDLLRELRELKPTIVHFSGHGALPIAATDRAQGRDIVATAPSEDELGGVVFDSANGRSQVVAPEAIARTFGALSAQVRLVLLNACYTTSIAEALLAHVDCVVGMSGAIHDDAARSFAIGFYGGLGEHESVAAAFEQGKAAINLDGLFDAEHPQLKVRDGFDAAQLILAAVPPSILVDVPCPYPGMRPFAADDADSFHGRGSEISELIGRLRAGEREIIVIGPSGSGKSSLVTAGVLPRLARGVTGLGQFIVRELRPGEQPAERLGQALELPAGEPLVVADRVARLLTHRGPGASLLIVVDQLEELFTLASAGERARFLDALRVLRAEHRCAVVFTLRADFFGAFMESALWAERRGQLSRVEVSPLRDEALREAIAAPAQAVGVAVESELIERLVADAASEPGILPLLQETMVQLWDVRVDQTLTLADYRALGDGERSGLAVALARRADATVRRFTPAQAAIARRILLRLVAFGEGRSDTRRQQAWSKLCASAEETGVLRQMIDDRLLTAGEENGGEPRIDLAHEIMIAAWPTLAGWIQRHRVDEQRRRQLEAVAAQWVEHGRGARGLLDPIELAEATSWQQTESSLQLVPSTEVSDLIAASRAAQVKQRRRRRLLLGSAFAVLAAVAVVVAVLAIAAQESANDAHRESSNAHQRLVQLQLGLGRQLLDSDHPDRAVPYLLAARESGIEDVSLRALFRWATQYLPIQRLVHHGFVRHVAWSPDGRWLATGSDDRTVEVWNPGSGQPVMPPLVHDSMIRAIAWSPRGTWLATADDHSVRVWDVRTWTPATALLVHEGKRDIGALLWSSDGSHLAIASGYTVRIWDAASGREATPPLTHQGGILTMAWSPDGQRMATKSVDMTARLPNKAGIWPASGTIVRIWDAALGREATPPLTHQGSIINAVAWSPDGQRVATASVDHTARVWDARSGQAVTPPLVHGGPVFALTWSPDGRRLATGSNGRTARVWDANSGQPLGLPIAHASEVSMIAWSPDGRHVASFGNGTAWVWDPDSAIRPQVWFTVDSGIHNGKQEANADSRQVIPPLPVRSVNRIAWSPDGKWLATASSDGTAQVWDAGSQQAVTPPLPNRGDVLALAWSPDSRRLATGSWDQRARIWDVARGQSMPPLSHDGVVSAVAWSFDGRRLATASWDKTARVWDANSGQPVTPPLLHQGTVNTVAWSPGGKRLATASDDQTARVWDADNGQEVTPSLMHPRRVTLLAWSPLGRQLATASDDQTTHVWNTDTGQEVTPPLAYQGFVTALVWSSGGRQVATAAMDGTARLWDAGSGQAITPPLQHRSRIVAMAWSPDGRRVATASEDATARVWDAITGQPLTPPLAQGGDVTAVAWSPDGNRLATVSVNGTALVWDPASGEAVTPPLTHRGRVSKLAWSPDGALLATASDDQTARVWDAASGQPVTPPLMHRLFLTAVAWSPDGRRLATASADKTARVWDVLDAGTLADWRAAAERCDYRLNSAGVLVERDPVPDEHSTAAGLPSASPSSFSGQGSGGSPGPGAGSGSAVDSGSDVPF